MLDEVLHSDLSIDREDLYTRLAAELPRHLVLEIVVVERRRFAFSETDIKTDRLYLPYLSFGFAAGKVTAFSSPTEVAKAVETARQNGRIAWEKSKTVVICDALVKDEREIVLLLEQIILAFYYACGHYDHFMTNASRRFVKDFIKQQRTLNTSEVIKAITGNTNCHSLYLEYDSDGEAPSLVEDPEGLFCELDNCPKFRADLKRALAKKGTFSGRSSSGMSYLVSVAALDRSYEALSEIEYTPSGAGFALARKRHALVLCRSDAAIPMDAIKFGPHLFHLHLANDAFSARERLIFGIYSGVADVERQFSAEPPSRKTDIAALTKHKFGEILDAALNVTAAELLVVRLHDPFSESLVAITEARRGRMAAKEHSSDNFSVPESTALEAFRQGGARTFEFSTSRDKASAGHDYEGLCFVFPIRIGFLTRGILECYSTRRAQLRFDEDYLRAIANAIGDAARRIEASADVSWLSRLSFLHSARHELENFLPELHKVDKALFSSLRSTLDRYSGVGPAPWRGENPSLESQAKYLFRNASDSAQVDRLVEQIDTLEAVYEPDAGFRFVLSEVLSTLVSNAIKHSTLRAVDFRLEFGEGAPTKPALAIKYRSADKRISPRRADRVTTSPIPDSKSSTFHYGLFLLAAQVRMNGGAAFMNTNAEVELDTIPFEICFTLPLYPLSDTDAD